MSITHRQKVWFSDLLGCACNFNDGKSAHQEWQTFLHRLSVSDTQVEDCSNSWDRLLSLSWWDWQKKMWFSDLSGITYNSNGKSARREWQTFLSVSDTQAKGCSNSSLDWSRQACARSIASEPSSLSAHNFVLAKSAGEPMPFFYCWLFLVNLCFSSADNGERLFSLSCTRRFHHRIVLVLLCTGRPFSMQ
jgi:hypothetical protein